jgi:prophage regulatory protein
MASTTRLLRLPRVIELTGLGRDSIYRLARKGQFPRPRKLTAGGRSSAWREDEVQAWIDSRPASDAPSPNPVASRGRNPAQAGDGAMSAKPHKPPGQRR